jgi:omega-6 fatty acid desaturase (delta-12 desaturase)
VDPAELLKEQKRALIREYTNANDREGFRHVLVTVLPLAAVWWIAVWGLDVSLWITAAATLAISVLMMRLFSLMHDCGHGSLFRTRSINRAVGFLFGVATGMPQYVWSQHHRYHHQTNGNWEKYRGALNTLTVDQYEALSGFRQWVYRSTRHIAIMPLAGFIYLIFNPRFNWIKGSLSLLLHVLRGKGAATFKTRYWKTFKEYRHQSANNVVLAAWGTLMCWAIGPVAFFAIYLISNSLAGGAGIALFTIQHNFAGAYASEDADWDIDEGTISGTSFLILPRWLNWATADIAYHHVHHLSASIPSYSLAACHAANAHLFTSVRRIALWEIPRNLKCLLWDAKSRRIISFGEYESRLAQLQQTA